MDLRKLNEFLNEYELQYGDVLQIVSDKKFADAGTLGEEWVKSVGGTDFEDAPFCIDQIASSKTNVVVGGEAVEIIKKMKSLATSQSYTPQKLNDNYEACFCLTGRKEGDTIIIDEAFWDKDGFAPNRQKYYDPDNYDALPVYDDSSNVTTESEGYLRKVSATCKIPVSAGSTRVVISGHTHPQTRKMGKINNYPSRTDIVLAVEEAAKNYVQGDKTCIYLNAIVNADGDLNIYGVDAQGEFVIFNKVQTRTGKQIASYTEGNYPLSNSSTFTSN